MKFKRLLLASFLGVGILFTSCIEEDPALDELIVVLEKVSDVIHCNIPSGELRLRMYLNDLANEIEIPEGTSVQWYYRQANLVPVPDEEGGKETFFITGEGGEFTVIVNHDLYGEFILSEIIDVDLKYPIVTINLLSHQTIVDPPNGKLEAIVEGGNETCIFQWEDVAGPLLPPESYNSPIADRLVAGTFTVVVTLKESGCVVTESAIIHDMTD